MKVYQAIAQEFVARENCAKTGNLEWKEKHEQAIEKLVDDLPHGNGIDGKTKFDFDRSTPEKLIITSAYRYMDARGYYDGWTEFELVITASLQFGFDLKVRGSFPRKYTYTRDYLYEIFSLALEEVVEE